MGPPLLALLLLFLVPESPTYLVKKDKITAAENAIQKCYGPHFDVGSEISRIQSGLQVQPCDHEGWILMFKRPEVFKPFCIIIGLSIIQQFSGMSILRAYVVKIFADVFDNSGNQTTIRQPGECEHNVPAEAYIAAILIGFMRFLSSLLLSKLLYHFRRRTMYFLSGE